MIRAEQDRAFMSTAELSRERQLDQDYTARLYRRMDELRHDVSFTDECLHQHSEKFALILAKECDNEVEELAVLRTIRHELNKLAEAHARIDVKDED